MAELVVNNTYVHCSKIGGAEREYICVRVIPGSYRAWFRKAGSRKEEMLLVGEVYDRQELEGLKAAKAAEKAEKAAKESEPSARDVAREAWGFRPGVVTAARTDTHEDGTVGAYVTIRFSQEDFDFMVEACAPLARESATEYPKLYKKPKEEAPAEAPAPDAQ